MHIRIVLLTIGVAVVVCGCGRSTTCAVAPDRALDTKPQSVDHVKDILDEICQLAAKNSRNVVDKTTEGRIDGLVNEINSTKQLALLGRLCAEIAWPQNADDASFDLVFDYAAWRCFCRISERSDPESIETLERLQSRYGQDGGPSLVFRQLQERQQRSLKSQPGQ